MKIFKNVTAYRAFKMRLISISFIVTVLAIISMNFITFKSFDSAMIDELNKVTRAQLENVSAAYKNQIVHYQNLSNIIYYNPVITSVIYSAEEDNLLKKVAANNFLQPLLSSNFTLTAIFLFRNGEILYEKDSFYIDLPIKQSVLEQINKTTTDKYPLIVAMPKQDTKKIVVFHSSRQKLNGNADDGVALLIDASQLQRAILADYPNSREQLFITDLDNNLLISQNNNKYSDFSFWHRIDDSEENFNYFVDGDKVVSYVTNINESYRVISVADYSVSREKLAFLRSKMLIFTLIFCVVAFLIVYLGTKILYFPLVNTLSNVQTRLQKFDSFTNTSPKMTDINALIESTAIKMESLQSSRANTELSQYLCGLHTNSIPEQVTQIFEFIEKYDLYRIVTFESDDLSVSSKILLSKIINLMDDKAFNHEIPSYLAYTTDTLKVMLVLPEQGISKGLMNSKTIILITENICSKLKNEGLSIFAGVSALSTTSAELVSSYNQSCSLVRYRIFYRANMVFYADDIDITIEKRRNDALLTSLTETMLVCLNDEQAIDINSFVQTLFESILQDKLGYEDALKLLSNLLAIASRLSHGIVVDTTEYHNTYLDCYLKMDTCNNQEELRVLLQQFFNNISLEIKIVNSKTVQDSVLSAMEYINNHFDYMDLSIELLAEKYNISASYFSKLFNKHTKKTFPDYLNTIRLQKATEMLLTDKTDSISEIALKTGFSSSSYFSSAFRKKYGISPSKFRLNSNNNNEMT